MIQRLNLILLITAYLLAALPLSAAVERLQIAGEWCFIETPDSRPPIGAVILMHGNGETVGPETSTWQSNAGERLLMNKLLDAGYLLAQSNAAATPANGMWGNADTERTVLALVDYLRQNRGISAFDAIAVSAGNVTLLNLELEGRIQFRHAALVAPVISLVSLYRCPAGSDRVTGISVAFGFTPSGPCPGKPETDAAFRDATAGHDPLRTVQASPDSVRKLAGTAWMACYEEHDAKVPPPENILLLSELLKSAGIPVPAYVLAGASGHTSKEMLEGCAARVIPFFAPPAAR